MLYAICQPVLRYRYVLFALLVYFAATFVVWLWRIATRRKIVEQDEIAAGRNAAMTAAEGVHAP
jgi:ABC-type transport system involved in Fe-S cluster assembly fused permease/ATPase subunit